MYKTILEEGQCEIVVEKSRFIAYAYPIKTEQEAQHFVEILKKKNWQATHNVPVYVLGTTYAVQRYSDDGEPSGTAGLPVLEMLKKAGITNVCLIITRYFGGVKLGTGGLVRAYTEAAKAVLTEIGLAEVNHYEQFDCSYDYTFQGKITHLLSTFDTQGLQTDYGSQVSQTFYVPVSQAEKLTQSLIDITSNQLPRFQRSTVYGCIAKGQFIKMDD